MTLTIASLGGLITAKVMGEGEGGPRPAASTAGLSDSSVHHLHRVQSAALRQAVKWGLINIDVRTVAGRLGYSDATTTLRVYAHLVKSRDQHAADLLVGLISGRAAPWPG